MTTRKKELPAPARLQADGRWSFAGGTVKARLVAAGDLCPIHRVEPMLVEKRLDAAFERALELFGRADATVVNLEAPLTRAETPIPKCGPNFRAAPEVAYGLAAAGIDVCCLANNHIMDQGPQGLDDTLEALEDAGLQFLGAGPDLAAASAPLRLEAGGLRVALLNLAEGEFSRSSGRAGAAGLDPAANCRAVSDAAAQADVTLVFLHGGSEQVLFPSPLMQQRCRALIEAGASAVIAHHPHVPQGIEAWQGRPIVYSLGNFLFDWPEPEPETDSSFLLELGLSAGGVSELLVHPFRKSAAAGVELLTGTRRSAYVRLLDELSAPLADAGLMSAIWDEQCRELWRRRYAGRLRRLPGLFATEPGEQRKAGLTAYNLVHCEAHAEGLAHALELLVAKRFEPDPPTRERLDGWMSRLKSFAAA